ncbi:hypothetical protein HPP92_012221 [Vanilla planifolia]|uniref:Uncharacterized protein n=1 Tax=Vanilla planifolia TaxID=51239 RepID=A0A835RDX7_VANPL|nr:hypothetical protein HPP92_012221 [Vanilla planifolia]
MVVPGYRTSCPSHHHHRQQKHASNNSGDAIEILAFEAAVAMSRLVSLHRSLSDADLLQLRYGGMHSAGVAYLTSGDNHFLLRLACAELLSDLDSVAATVSRFATRCCTDSLLSFERKYADFKIGIAVFTVKLVRSLSFKGAERRVKQMEKCVATIGILLREMEALAKLEADERKIESTSGWYNVTLPSLQNSPTAFTLETKAQRKTVARLKEESLWCKTFDEVVALMSPAVLAVFARICAVFGPFVSSLPLVLISPGSRMSFSSCVPKCRIYPRLAGSHNASEWMPLAEASGGRRMDNKKCLPQNCEWKENRAEASPGMQEGSLKPSARTVSGAGLTMRYANVVTMAERIMRMRSGELDSGEGDEEAARQEIYRLLPTSLQVAVRLKLKERWRERGSANGNLTEGWREAVQRILRWLGPVARDTMRWQEERALDRRQRLKTNPRVLAWQTLLFSDREKTEAAIIEVLVGLSCIYWYGGHLDSALQRRLG